MLTQPAQPHPVYKTFRSNQFFAFLPRVFGVSTNPTGFVLLFPLNLSFCDTSDLQSKMLRFTIQRFLFCKSYISDNSFCLYVCTSSEITLACLLFISCNHWICFCLSLDLFWSLLWICQGRHLGFAVVWFWRIFIGTLIRELSGLVTNDFCGNLEIRVSSPERQ